MYIHIYIYIYIYNMLQECLIITWPIWLKRYVAREIGTYLHTLFNSLHFPVSRNLEREITTRHLGRTGRTGVSRIIFFHGSGARDLKRRLSVRSTGIGRTSSQQPWPPPMAQRFLLKSTTASARWKLGWLTRGMSRKELLRSKFRLREMLQQSTTLRRRCKKWKHRPQASSTRRLQQR